MLEIVGASLSQASQRKVKHCHKCTPSGLGFGLGRGAGAGPCAGVCADGDAGADGCPGAGAGASHHSS